MPCLRTPAWAARTRSSAAPSGAPTGSSTPARSGRDRRARRETAGVGGPYVRVGHSFGGANVQLYAAEYPKEVAGMVLVDSALDSRVLDKDLRDAGGGAAAR